MDTGISVKTARNLAAIAALLSVFLMLSQDVLALSVGVSPVRIEFRDVLRGGYAERGVTISTSDARNITGHFVKFGDIASWIRLDPDSESIVFSRNSPYHLKVIVEPPPDAANGVYSGEIRFMTDTVASPDGTVGAAVKASVTLTIEVTISDRQVAQCSAGGVSLKDTETGLPINIEWLVRNGGNVRLAPKMIVDIWDKQRKNLYVSKDYATPEVLPTTEHTTTEKLSSERLPLGQYWAYVKIAECDFSTITTFDVLEKGAISDHGELLGIEAKPWVYAADTVPVRAKFANRGIRDVAARFKAEIRKNEDLVGSLESPEVIVSSGQTVDLTALFSPKEEGKYLIIGNVIYNKKITFDKSTIINVMERQFSWKAGNILLIFAYIGIIAAIIILLRKILRERKRR